MVTVPPPTPGTSEAFSVAKEARAVVAEHDPFEGRPVSTGVVADGIYTPADLRLLLEIVRRILWEEGEI